MSRYDLDVTFTNFPPGRGFYIGEYQGVVVASCVRLHWGDDVFYGSYYYVKKEYRGKGFGTRMRDDVAYGHVIEAGGKLCIDAVTTGSVAKKNVTKFGYHKAWMTNRFSGEVKYLDVMYEGKIVPVCIEKILHDSDLV